MASLTSDTCGDGELLYQGHLDVYIQGFGGGTVAHESCCYKKPFLLRLFCPNNKKGTNTADGVAIHLQLTDEGLLSHNEQAEPVTLYTMTMNEANFEELRKEQQLRVLFDAFPTKIVELLNKCEHAVEQE